MHFCCRLITLLLLVTLPAYAWAVLGLPQSCSMQSAPAPVADAAHACALADAADEDGSPRTSEGASCEPGLQCKTGSLYHLQVQRTLRAHFMPAPLSAAAEVSIYASDPSGIWRPPRIL